jgi:hypothetical protein
MLQKYEKPIIEKVDFMPEECWAACTSGYWGSPNCNDETAGWNGGVTPKYYNPGWGQGCS